MKKKKLANKLRRIEATSAVEKRLAKLEKKFRMKVNGQKYDYPYFVVETLRDISDLKRKVNYLETSVDLLEKKFDSLEEKVTVRVRQHTDGARM